MGLIFRLHIPLLGVDMQRQTTDTPRNQLLFN